MGAPELISDEENGEGTALVPADWLADDPMLRADLLKDWIADLTAAYNTAVDQFHAQLMRGRREA